MILSKHKFSVTIILIIVFIIIIGVQYYNKLAWGYGGDLIGGWKKESSLINELKNNPAAELNENIITSLFDNITFNDPTYGKLLLSDRAIFSWNTKYGRIYADQCSGAPHDNSTACSDGGTVFYGANGEKITTCDSPYKQSPRTPRLCDYLNTLKAKNADLQIIHGQRIK